MLLSPVPARISQTTCALQAPLCNPSKRPFDRLQYDTLSDVGRHSASTGILQPNTSYPFITSGVGLYAAYLAGTVFSPLIIDYNNLSSVLWGSYWHGPVVQGSGGNPDSVAARQLGLHSGGGHDAERQRHLDDHSHNHVSAQRVPPERMAEPNW